MNLDIQKYKKALEAELAKLEQEITSVAKKEGEVWEGVQTEVGEDTADSGDVSNSIENYTLNTSITSDLEAKIVDIRNALDKIDANNYGLCEICQGEIEEARLDVEPEARTCELHMN